MHRSELRKGAHHSPYLQASWNKHGEGAFVFEVLERCEAPELTQREQHWIDAKDAYSQGYNSRPVAESNRGRKWTTGERANHLARPRKPFTPEHLEALRQANQARVGTHLSEETKEKIRQKRLGIKLTPEHRAKVVKNLSFKGRVHTEESKRLLREARARQVITEEHVAKVAEANRGKKRSDDQRKHISDGLKGHVVSEETRRKISETKKRRHLERLQVKAS